MEEFNEIPKNKFNFKKFLIVLVIILILLGISIFAIYFFRKKTITNTNTSKTYFIDNNFQITVDNKYDLANSEISDKHIFKLHSENNLNIYIDKIENLDNYSLFMITRADRNYFPSTFPTASNVSEISENTINNFPTASYNFEYLDEQTNQNFYIQVLFININNFLYTIDIEFPITDAPTLLPEINSILSTIN